jgi:hypothetical protein
MFGFIGEVLDDVTSVARDVVSPVTDTVESVTGIDSEFQKDILEDAAYSALLGEVIDILRR